MFHSIGFSDRIILRKLFSSVSCCRTVATSSSRYTLTVHHRPVLTACDFRFESIRNFRVCSALLDAKRKVEISDLKKPEAEHSRTGPVSWRNLAIVTVVFGGFAYIIIRARQAKEQEREAERHRSIGKSLIGGPWELVNHDGKTVSWEEYKGKWYLIYFGFTHCPDICPDELEKMAKIVDLMHQAKGEQDYVQDVEGLFFTVDPERDTPGRIKKYVQEFHPKFVGFTGSKEQVEKVCKTFRVYSSQGPSDEVNDYIVDHTIIIYLVNPEGAFVDYYSKNRNAEDVVRAIKLHQQKYSTLKKRGII